MDTKSVSVAVRVRPVLSHGVSAMHQQEKFEPEAVTRISDRQLLVKESRTNETNRSSTFTFDYIFDQESTQTEVYETAIVDLVDAALMGCGATVLAYGQTGSGKTHTVLGDIKLNPLEKDPLAPESGIFLRVLSDLVEYKDRRAQQVHVTIGLSCVEVYNDNIRDLFSGQLNEAPPTIKAVLVGDDVFLPQLTVKDMTTLSSVYDEVMLAIKRRHSRSTEANATSSRSHCLFFLTLLQCAATAPPPSLDLLREGGRVGGGGERRRTGTPQPTERRNSAKHPPSSSPVPTPPSTPTAGGGWYLEGFEGMTFHPAGQEEPVYVSRILLADLAGSEKIKQSGVTGEGLQEATSINASLTALGNVVHSLYEGGFVSYRTSKLTQLLKQTFSHPKSKTLLLAQVSPTQLTYDETVSTLHFANKVKAVKVQSVIGVDADKTFSEYLECSRLYESLLAEMRLSMLEFERPLIIRSCIGHHVKDVLPPIATTLYGKARKGTPSNPQVSVSTVSPKVVARGILERANEIRMDLEKKAVIREREHQVKRQAKIAKERESLIEQYHADRLSLEKEYAAICRTHADNAKEELQQEASVFRLANEFEESIAWSQLHFHMLSLRRRTLDAEAAATQDHVTTAINTLRTARKALQKSQSSGQGELTEEQAWHHEINTLIAQDAFAHCVAMRFHTSLMSLRECQWISLQLQLDVVALQRWISTVPSSMLTSTSREDRPEGA